MYQLVLAAALATSTAAPNHCLLFRGHGCWSCGYSCYSGYAGYAGYAGYGHGCNGCYAYPVVGYGCAGGCYGNHGGCYGGWGIYGWGEPYYYGCTGCYGAYGGYACYGVPLPFDQMARPKEPPVRDPVVDPKKKPAGEEVPLPKEKKLGSIEQPSPERAIVKIIVPDGGKLFVDGRPLNVAPGTHTFRTPDLVQGQTYFYDFRIDVERQGQTIREERRILIRPGQEATVTFSNGPPTGTNAAAIRR